jgi:glycosyltransferase involved in cell wall biosynthesis
MVKKVLFVLPSLKTGGAEQFMVNLLCELSSYSSYEVSLYLLGGVRDQQGETLINELRIRKTVIVGSKNRKAITWSNLLDFNAYVRHIKPDIIFSTVIQADLAVCYYKLCSIFTGKDFSVPVRRLANSSHKFSDHILDILSVVFFKNIIFCSPVLQEKSKWLKIWRRMFGVDSQVIINGIPKQKIKLLTEIARHRIELKSRSSPKSDRLPSFSAGRLEGRNLGSMQKGFDRIVLAMARSRGKQRPIRHYIYGDGVLHGDLVELIESQNLSRFIQVEPAQPIIEILRNHEVLLFPSRFEGLSNLVIESLLAGCHTFLSDIPENQIFREFPENVTFFDSSINGLEGILEEVETAKGTTHVLDDVANRFSMDRCVREYHALFSKILRA